MKLLDVMIATKSLCEFVSQVIGIRNEEQEEKAIWEMWLHKGFDESFADFKARLTTGTNMNAPKKEDIEATVRESFSMLCGFVPEGVHDHDGTVSSAGDGSG